MSHIPRNSSSKLLQGFLCLFRKLRRSKKKEGESKNASLALSRANYSMEFVCDKTKLHPYMGVEVGPVVGKR